MPQLSPGVAVAWIIAAKEATDKNAADIEPEHFLAALTKLELVVGCEDADAAGNPDLQLEAAKEEGHLVRTLLRDAGFDPDELRHRLRIFFPTRPPEAPQGDKIHRSALTKQAFEIADRIARELGHKQLTCLHLLMAILRQAHQRLNESPAFRAIFEPRMAEFQALLRATPSQLRAMQPGPLPPKAKAPTLVDLYTVAKDRAIHRPPKVLVGRRALMLRLLPLLTDGNKGSIVLLGPAGAGKKALLMACARRLFRLAQSAESQASLYVLPGSPWVASGGPKQSLTQMSQALVAWLKGAEPSTTPAMLCLTGGELLAIAGFLGNKMPFDHLVQAVGQGDRRLLLVLTPEEYERVGSIVPSLLWLCERVVVPELNPRATRRLLFSLGKGQKLGREVRLTPFACTAAVELSRRLLPDEGLPGKAIALIEKSIAFVHPRGQGQKLPRGAEQLVNGESGPAKVTPEAVAQALKLRLGKEIPRAFCQRAHFGGEWLLRLEESLTKRIVDQQSAIRTICQRLQLIASGLTQRRPVPASFLFVGPPGVGKTLLAEALASALATGRKTAHRIDLSGYRDGEATGRLVGQISAAIASSVQAAFTRGTRSGPLLVLCLEHSENASPEVQQFLADWIKRGFVYDSVGRLICLHDAIVVIECSVDESMAGLLEPGHQPTSPLSEDIAARLAPELASAVDEVIVFSPLCRESLLLLVEELVRRTITVVKRRYSVHLLVDDAVPRLIAEEAFRKGRGGWSVRQLWKERVLVPLGRQLVAGQASQWPAIELVCEGTTITCRPGQPRLFRKEPPGPACCECGRRLAPEDKEKWRWLGHLFLCPQCRQRVDEILSRPQDH